jgi:hypothetical protein
MNNKYKVKIQKKSIEKHNSMLTSQFIRDQWRDRYPVNYCFQLLETKIMKFYALRAQVSPQNPFKKALKGQFLIITCVQQKMRRIRFFCQNK